MGQVLLGGGPDVLWGRVMSHDGGDIVEQSSTEKAFRIFYIVQAEQIAHFSLGETLEFLR